jgi:Arc/MetJ family transcription regulator
MLTGAHRDARFARMRTTVSLDDDVAAAVERLRRARNLGLSEALNELVRAGLQAPAPEARFRQRAVDLGAGVDVRNVAEALELAEGPAHR